MVVEHRNKQNNGTNQAVIVLHNIRSVYNVGSIFRTADAAGVSKIYLTGYTPTPYDRFNRPRKDVSKVALGAEKNVPWEYGEDVLGVLKRLKRINFQLVAIEQSDRSIDYKKVHVEYPIAFVFGSEVEGLPSSVLEESDIVSEIPMMGQKESLNVSVSVGVSVFRILNI